MSTRFIAKIFRTETAGEPSEWTGSSAYGTGLFR
ncbi:MAG: hypothetical protein QOK33_5534 [Mycobacterium sp.]|nr:hypothetical protein [Mycobacterium sp.]MDT5402303.1 hypothetical protein [Mycobacterium sp.]